MADKHPAYGRVAQIVNDVRLNFGEGQGTLGEVATLIIDAVEERPERNGHSWYHDGDVDRVEPGTDIKPRGRQCQHCGFREGVIKGVLCFGDRTILNSAVERGRAMGAREERERMREVLGL